MAAVVSGLSMDCGSNEITISGTGFVDGMTIEVQGPGGADLGFALVSLSATQIVVAITGFILVPATYCATVT